MHYHLTLKSGNKKTGPIPVSTSPADTCPDACPLKKNGCYADSGPLAMHWKRVTETRIDNARAFLQSIGKLPPRQLWRHNQAGDLPGRGNRIDRAKLRSIVDANAKAGARGFTYTHKPITAANARAIADANRRGFTINLSANSLGHADALWAHHIAPVVAIVPEGTPRKGETPRGTAYVQCPATYRDTTCADCGLCAVASTTRPIVTFPVHGASKRKAETVSRGAA